MTMIYEVVPADAPLSQGDVVDGGTILFWTADPESPDDWYPESSSICLVVLTQACDLAQGKSERVLVAPVHTANRLVRDGVLNARTVRDQVRLHRVYGWYFLSRGPALEESNVDLRDLHTLPRTMLEKQVVEGHRLARIATPYREHMAQHFSSTYARISLPTPYETEREQT